MFIMPSKAEEIVEWALAFPPFVLLLQETQ